MTDRRDRTDRAILYAKWARFSTLLAWHILLEGRAACSLVRLRGKRGWLRCALCQRRRASVVAS